MSDTNYIGVIVKILESPKTRTIENNISVTKFRAQLPQTQTAGVVDIVVWGNLANDLAKYYNISDYILVEGYLSLFKFSQSDSSQKGSERAKLTLVKAYPFLLSSNSRI